MSVSRVSNATAATAVAGLHMVTPTSVTVSAGTGSVSGQGAVSFSTVPTLTINNCFSSNYSQYKIMIELTGAAANNQTVIMQLHDGTNPVTSNYYYANIRVTEGGTTSNRASTTATGVHLFFSTTQDLNAGMVEMFSPATTVKTKFMYSMWVNDGSTGSWMESGTASQNNNTAYTGLRIVNTSGITGTIRIYGYNNGGA
jgi:hypothetical protein